MNRLTIDGLLAMVKEDARQEGRDEILREVARFPSPMVETRPFEWTCSWCGAVCSSDEHLLNPSCLWPRAMKVGL